MKNLVKIFIAAVLACATFCGAQQPQTQTDPTFATNSQWVNGVAPGYAPTTSGGLVLNLGPGTAVCNFVVDQYAGGTLTLTASTTNYVYLNAAGSCSPAFNTSGFNSNTIPLAVVNTNGSNITNINDVRTSFTTGISGGGGGTQVSLNAGSTQPTLAINGYMPQTCVDSTGGSNAQQCTTADTFTPQTGNSIIYQAPDNPGAQVGSLTLEVNGAGAKPIAIQGPTGWTTSFPLGFYFPTTPVLATYDGTNWDVSGTGIIPGGYLPGFELTTNGSVLSYNLTGGWVNCNGVSTLVGGVNDQIANPDDLTYVFLNTSGGCAISSNDTGFGSNVPLYLITSDLSITSIVDHRSMFYTPSSSSTFYQTVQANGTSQTQQPKLNLLSGSNATVSCANNSGASSTDCTVSATGGSGSNFFMQRASGSLFPPPSSVQFTNEEPSAVYEGSPQLLSSSYGKVFKLWYDAGFTSPDSTLNYAESPDGMPGTWVQSGSNPLISPCARSWVFENGATYEAFCTNGELGTHIDRYTSSNGISWTLAHANAITATQSWQSTAAGAPGNAAVLINGSTWYDLQEWLSTDGNWRIGLWTSPDGNTWTPFAGNPIIPTSGMSSTGGCSGPWFTLMSGTYYTLVNCNGPNGTGSGVLPNQIYAFSSANAETWTAIQTPPWLQPSTQDEGIGLATAQVADPFLLEADVTGGGNPRSYLFYEGTPNGSINGSGPLAGLHLKVATVNAPIASLFAAGVTVLDGDPKPPSSQVDQCFPGNLETAAFAGPENLAVTSYASPCGNSFAVYSADGATPVTASLSGSNSANLFVSGTFADMLDSYVPPSADYVVSMTTSSHSGQPGLFARAVAGSATYYFLGCDDIGASSVCKLFKDVSGTTTQLGSTYTFTWTAGATHTIALSTVGTNITAAIDGTIPSVLNVTDSSISAAGQAGFRVTAGVQATSFAVRNAVVSPSISGMTATQLAVAGGANNITSSIPVNGGGAGVPTGPASTTTGDCVEYANTTGKQADTGSPCGSGGGSGAWTNLTSTVTAAGCTVSGGACAVSGSSTVAVTFSAIPGTYNRLQLVNWGQGSSSANIDLTFNGDTASHYSVGGSFQGGTSAPAWVGTSPPTSSCLMGNVINGVVSTTIADVPFYANTSFDKAVVSNSVAIGSVSSSSNNIDIRSSCGWNQTTAITSVTMTLSAGDYVAGTQFEILGQN